MYTFVHFCTYHYTKVTGYTFSTVILVKPGTPDKDKTR